METTIKVRTTAAMMSKIFESPDLVYIKFYTTTKKEEIKEDQLEDLNFFNVTIRHSQDEDPVKLFKNAEKLLQ